ncbi:uncharacterized protein LOC117602599 [Osmia lignaria lignaria]|uniref:uncharacterized protein LOC117602599 n=1 Tax=Osmia lignaria lignaria TaxID=1437193 RepID=UPI00402B581D
MLNVVAPGKLVLTLQSIPPFVVESVFALALAVLLATPLILHLQHFLDDSMKSRAGITPAHRGIQEKERSQPVVTHYPASVFVDSASSSSVNLLESARKTISTPILQASGDNVDARREKRTQLDFQEDEGATKRKEVPLKQSSSYVATNSELPIIDISAFDYDAYRYKLIEAALKKQYDDYQPPGDVVLNSIHLNDDDSSIALRLNDRYHHSLFDFVEEYYDATQGMSKRETEYMHPLDHFLAKGTQKPETVEKETETRRIEVADAFGQDEKPRISFNDDTNESMKRESIVKKSVRSSNPRPSSTGADSTSSKRSTSARSSAKKSATKSSRTASSTDSASSKTRKREDRGETFSSVDGGERESINCTTISSIDSESVRSESSKLRDDHSYHSRDSLLASKRLNSDKPQILPWISGNPQVSFNKKYGQTNKTLKSKKSPTIRRSISSKQSVQENSESSSHISTEPSSIGRTSCRNDSRLRNNQPVKLEAIRSETEEFLKDSYSMNDESGRACSSTKFFDKSESSKIPESIDSPVKTVQHPSGERNLSKEDQQCSSKSLKSPSEKSSKLYRKPRSKTVSPAKASPRLKEQLENASVDGNAKKMAPESGGSFGKSYSSSFGKKNPLESMENKEEKITGVREVPKFKNLGSATTTKSNFSGNKMAAEWRSSQQKTIDSKANTAKVSSSKSASSDRKILKSGNRERSRINRLGLKESGPDGLKLPRRDSKAGIAMQVGLKKYIKKMKRVLSDRDNSNIGELASLSLTDAILPDLQSTLSTVEVQQVQNLLTMVEKKSELISSR